MLHRILVSAVIVKGLVMGLVVSAVSIAFIYQVALVIISSTVTGLFAFAVAWYTAQRTAELHARLDKIEQQQAGVAEAVGADPDPADRRHDDKP